MSKDVTARRVWAMPNSETFSVKPIYDFVHKYLEQPSIDPFSRNREWATYTNDLDPRTKSQYHLEALEFLGVMKSKSIRVKTAIFDPPYSLEQCKRSYENVGRAVTMRDTQIWGRWTDHKDVISELLEPDGIFLHFGWHSNGMGLKRGFEIFDMLVVAHGGGHNDTICIAECRIDSHFVKDYRPKSSIISNTLSQANAF